MPSASCDVTPLFTVPATLVFWLLAVAVAVAVAAAVAAAVAVAVAAAAVAVLLPAAVTVAIGAVAVAVPVDGVPVGDCGPGARAAVVTVVDVRAAAVAAAVLNAVVVAVRAPVASADNVMAVVMPVAPCWFQMAALWPACPPAAVLLSVLHGPAVGAAAAAVAAVVVVVGVGRVHGECRPTSRVVASCSGVGVTPNLRAGVLVLLLSPGATLMPLRRVVAVVVAGVSVAGGLMLLVRARML